MIIKEIQKYCIDELNKANIEESNLKAKLIIADVINKNKEYLITHYQEKIEDKKIEKIKNNIEKLITGIPIQYITNKQEFMGINFFVDENVLIPQPDTEILVEEVIQLTNDITGPKILDLCTGSGAIAISLEKYIQNARVVASDISSKALEIASKNAKDNCLNINFLQSDLFVNVKDKFNIIVSNPPYIKTKEIATLSKEVQNEPHIALDGGQDGLNFYRKIINEAHKYLKDSGYLCLEIGYDQKEDVIKLINKSNRYKEIYFKKDLSGNDRVIICKKM